MQGIPKIAALSASATILSTEWRDTPGMLAMGSEIPLPSQTKSGQIRSAGVRMVSRTMSRTQWVRRIRRGRDFGKGAGIGRIWASLSANSQAIA